MFFDTVKNHVMLTRISHWLAQADGSKICLRSPVATGPIPRNMQMRKTQVVKVNIDLWNDASPTERQWIQSNLVSTGLIQRTALIEGSGDADLLEIAEIDARVRRLEEKHAGSSCAGRCRKAYADAMLKCAGIFFADQRKRFKNAAYQAYALCLRQCTSQ